MELSTLLKEDIATIFNSNMKVENLNNKTFLITGVTGLIGSMLCRTLSCVAKQENLTVKILGMARNEKKAKEILADVMENSNITIVEQDISMPIQLEDKVDYIIHTACPTASNMFITKPVETIQAIVIGTANVLEFAKEVHCQSVVYLSSMEAYGQVLHENLLKPEDVGYINPLSLRSCYPEGKRMAENLCMAYVSEYEVPVKIVRLAQTFGPGILANDTRVFAQFIRSALAGENIVMFTEGGSKRMYLDTMDAVSAVFKVLFQGKSGTVYNAGNVENYCSIKEMAELVIREFGQGKSKLVIDRSKDVGQYPPDNMLFLDVSPLQELGWKAKYNLKDMYTRMIQGM